MSALWTLYDMISRGKTPPFDWIVEHAPDGTIGMIWHLENDPHALIGIAQYVDADAAMDALAELIVPLRHLLTVPSKTIESLFDDVAKRRHHPMSDKQTAEYRAFIRHAFATSAEIDAAGAAMFWVEHDGARRVSPIADKIVSAMRGAPVTTTSIRDPRAFVADVIRGRIPCPPLTELLAKVSRDA